MPSRKLTDIEKARRRRGIAKHKKIHQEISDLCDAFRDIPLLKEKMEAVGIKHPTNQACVIFRLQEAFEKALVFGAATTNKKQKKYGWDAVCNSTSRTDIPVSLVSS